MIRKDKESPYNLPLQFPESVYLSLKEDIEARYAGFTDEKIEQEFTQLLRGKGYTPQEIEDLINAMEYPRMEKIIKFLATLIIVENQL